MDSNEDIVVAGPHDENSRSQTKYIEPARENESQNEVEDMFQKKDDKQKKRLRKIQKICLKYILMKVEMVMLILFYLL